MHSAKDLPTRLTAGTRLAGVPERLSPLDALVSRDGHKLADLPPGTVIAVGSPRRRAFVRRLRSGVRMIGLRGNVGTRLKKIEEGAADAIVVAFAALQRLGVDATEVFQPERMMPAVAQGAIAVTVREEDDELADLIRGLSADLAVARVRAERAFLSVLGAGCHTPVGALATDAGHGLLELQAAVCSLDGKQMVTARLRGAADRPETLGEGLARGLLQRGAGGILNSDG